MPVDESHTSAARGRANANADAAADVDVDVVDVVVVAVQATVPRIGTRVRDRVHRYASADAHTRSSALTVVAAPTAVEAVVVCLRVLARTRRVRRASRRKVSRDCLWAARRIRVALAAVAVVVAVVGVPLADGRSCSCLRWIA